MVGGWCCCMNSVQHLQPLNYLKLDDYLLPSACIMKYLTCSLGALSLIAAKPLVSSRQLVFSRG